MTSSEKSRAAFIAILVGILALALMVAACDDPPACPEGQVRELGQCVDYVEGVPIEAPGAWRPAPGTTWQWQLTGAIDTSHEVEMYDVDLFNVTDDGLGTLSDRVVICYLSTGTWEAWRPDADQFPAEARGNVLEDWEDERWLDITHERVRELMLDRLDLAVERGCDGVEPDNMDGYANDNGAGLNATEQLAYNRFIADAAHQRGLSVGLKNDVDQLEALLPWFDWALNEECAAYDECSRYRVFTEANRAVFHVEYVDRWRDAEELASDICGVAPGFSTLIKTWDLGSEYLACL
jgi:hypothetical protein